MAWAGTAAYNTTVMRILFITSTYVGDAAVSTGVLAHLVTRHPQARITVVCGHPAASLFAAVPNLERVIPVVKQRANLHWFEVWRACIGTRWDLIVDLRSSLVPYLLRARARRVFRPRNPPGTQRVADWGRVIGLDDLPPPHVWIGADQAAVAARLVPAGPVLALGPTANAAKKIWPIDRFAELARRLTAPDGILAGARVAVLGAAGEQRLLQPLLDTIPEARRLDLVGKTDLITAAAVLKRSDFYVGNDSGLLFIAVAAGIPALGLFGPSPGHAGAQQTYLATWAKRAGFVRTTVPYEQLVTAPDHHRRRDLMDTLTVDMAEQGAKALWARTRDDAPARAHVA